MLKFQIKNYDEFKEIFGTKNSSRGCISNKILLEFWKYRFKIDGDGRCSAIKNLQDLYSLVMKMINNHRPKDPYFIKMRRYEQLDNEGSYRKTETYEKRLPSCNVHFTLGGNNYHMFNKRFTTDCLGGRSPLSIANTGMLTLYNEENGHIELVKAGRFMSQVLEENGARIGEAAALYVAEEFQRRVDAETTFTGNYELVIDKSFDKIYSSKYCETSFGSCMCDKHHDSFYTNAVNASAAYLIKKATGKIVARAILYHNVYSVADGKLHDYVDRTYGVDEDVKRVLTELLIKEKKVTLYKAIGAGCHDIEAIMDANGNRLANPGLAIHCNLKNGETQSYLDTFKYYDPTNGVASNQERMLKKCDGAHLDHTNARYEGHSCNIKKDGFFDRDLSTLISK